jgi:deoxyribonuclease IV
MTKKILLGAHTSTAGGVHNALFEGAQIGATIIQLFTSNQKQWKGRQFSKEELDLWNQALDQTGIEQIMSHDSYLINLGAHDSEILKKSRAAFREEIQRCQQLDLSYLNFHPGAATKSTVEECLDRIVESLLLNEDLVHSGKTKLVLEMTAGQGTSVGYQFEQIAYIIQRVQHRIPIGVCIDTCHVFVAGYDVRTKEGWEITLQEFDRIIGLKFLTAFHINDSAKDFGSKVDRHASLGLGKIGLECFRYLMTNPKTKEIPKYLETPEKEVWPKEIAMLKDFMVYTPKYDS